MSEAIAATYINGAFQPDKPLELTPGTRVRLVFFDVQMALTPEEADRAWEEFERLCEECPITSSGPRLTREQIYDRHMPVSAQEIRPSLEERHAAREEFNQICEELSVDLEGERLTRDQLHERR